MTDTNNFINKGSELIRSAVNLIFPSFVGGAANWTLKVTPSSVKKTKAFSFGQSRAEIPFDLDKGVRSLDSHTVTSYGNKTTLHIYEGGLKFPPLPGMDNQQHRLIEVAVFRTGWGKRALVQQPGESAKDFAERSTRFQEAFGSDRYWFAIPSRLGEKSIHIEGGGKNCKLFLASREYARLLAEHNQLSGGVWKGPEARRRLKLAIGLSAALWVVGLLVYISYFETLAGSLSATWFMLVSMGIGLLLIIPTWALTHFLPRPFVETL